MANKIVESVWRWSDQGRLPVLCDASSCSFGITSEVLHYLTLENLEKHKRLTLLDSVAWAYDYLLPRLKVVKRVHSLELGDVRGRKDSWSTASMILSNSPLA
jgi:D-lactate dehydrogenase